MQALSAEHPPTQGPYPGCRVPHWWTSKFASLNTFISVWSICLNSVARRWAQVSRFEHMMIREQRGDSGHLHCQHAHTGWVEATWWACNSQLGCGYQERHQWRTVADDKGHKNCYFYFTVLLCWGVALALIFVAARCATLPTSLFRSCGLVRLIFAAVERNFSLSLNPSIAGM